MAEQTNKRLAGLERVKARAALRVRQRFSQQDEEAELKRLENEAVKEAEEKKAPKKVSKPATTKKA